MSTSTNNNNNNNEGKGGLRKGSFDEGRWHYVVTAIISNILEATEDMVGPLDEPDELEGNPIEAAEQIISAHQTSIVAGLLEAINGNNSKQALKAIQSYVLRSAVVLTAMTAIEKEVELLVETEPKAPKRAKKAKSPKKAPKASKEDDKPFSDDEILDAAKTVIQWAPDTNGHSEQKINSAQTFHLAISKELLRQTGHRLAELDKELYTKVMMLGILLS